MAKKVLQYRSGEKIIRAGTRESKMYIILEGSVVITLTDGNESIILTELRKGDFFGEISLFINTPRSATVTAVTDCRLAYIDRIEELKAFLIKNPSFAAKMVQILARRLAQTDEILVGKISEMNRIKITQDI